MALEKPGKPREFFSYFVAARYHCRPHVTYPDNMLAVNSDAALVLVIIVIIIK